MSDNCRGYVLIHVIYWIDIMRKNGALLQDGHYVIYYSISFLARTVFSVSADEGP